MCLPAAALGVASSAASFIGQQQAASAANAAAAQNGVNASVAAGWKYSDNNARFIYNSKGLQREGNSATMAGRSAVGTGIASAGSSGITGLSLDALVADAHRKSAENTYAAGEKRDDLKMSLVTEQQSAKAEADSRIASMPTTSGPSPLALGIDVLTGLQKNGVNVGNLWGGASIPTFTLPS